MTYLPQHLAEVIARDPEPGYVWRELHELPGHVRLQVLFGGPPVATRWRYYEEGDRHYCWNTVALSEEWWAPIKWASWIQGPNGIERLEIHETRREAKDQAYSLSCGNSQ